MLLDAFGELPAAGAVIDLCGLKFTVEMIEHNRITQVLVERLPEVVARPETDAGDEFVPGAQAMPPAGEGAPASAGSPAPVFSKRGDA